LFGFISLIFAEADLKRVQKNFQSVGENLQTSGVVAQTIRDNAKVIGQNFG